MTSKLSQGTVISDHSNTYRCCGIRHRNWILTSGLIFCSYVSPDDTNESKHGSSINECDSNKKLRSVKILQNFNVDSRITKKIEKKRFKILLENNFKACSVNDKEMDRSSGDPDINKDVLSLSSYTAHVAMVFKSNLVNKYVIDNFYNWQLCTAQDQFSNISGNVIHYLLSVFVLLQIDGNNENVDCKTALTYFFNLTSGGCQNVFRGLDIIVESTPFALSQFYNSWSKGIISNNVGKLDCLFFTDTRLVTGCIGAPVYRYEQGQKGRLIGMILNPMLWSQGEWAGFSIAVNLEIILSEVLYNKTPVYRTVPSKDVMYKLFDDLDKSVVLIRCGCNWGSGVVVNAKLGVIVTCAHVVNYSKEELVTVVCRDYETKGRVVYSSKAGQAYDIAVLHTESFLQLEELLLAEHPPVKGETVYCVGFPMVSTSHVTVSKGIIANVVSDILIQTTCCVQSGASGGAIIRPSGELVGIIVSNMSCGITHALFPHCNFSIPSTAFTDILKQYFTTNAKSTSNVKIEVYFVLHEVNNTYSPSTFFNVNENVYRKFSSHEKVIIINETFHKNSSVLNIPIFYFLSIKNDVGLVNPLSSFMPNNKSNIQKEVIDERKNYDYSLKDKKFKRFVRRKTENLLGWKTDLGKSAVNFKNSSEVIYKNITLLLEINERNPVSAITNISTVIDVLTDGSCSNLSNSSNVSTIFLNGLWINFEKNLINRSSIHKPENGIYVVINPCLRKNCKWKSIVGFEFMSENNESVPSILNVLIKNNTSNISKDKLEKIMAVYYEDEDMSVWDYSLKDFLIFCFVSNYWLLFVSFILAGLYFRLRILYWYRVKNPFGESEYDTDPSLYTKSEMIKLIIEMKQIQNEFLMKMKDVLEKTNIKLQYLIEKLLLVEELLIDDRKKSTDAVTLKIYDNLSKVFSEEIDALKIKHQRCVDNICKLSVNLKQTQIDLKELKCSLEDFLDCKSSDGRRFHQSNQEFNDNSNIEGQEMNYDINLFNLQKANISSKTEM
ncbi:uncharacterized protein LOC142321728 [Lycorma delicatula]|uniref:uncharacterized protein LOC142321728 n=1 Tax=Lycorma delicatula TaxID=130591 RepID=UPI003F50FE26